MGVCSQEDFEKRIIELGSDVPVDFVRIEIARALHRKGINIIPVVPESTESYNFSKLNLPPDIVGIKRYESVFYSDHTDALFKDVVPKITKHLLSKPDSYFKKALLVIFAVIVIAVGAFYGYNCYRANQYVEEMRKGLMSNEINHFVIGWNQNATLQQAEAINEILNKMEPVEGGTFMMGTNNDEEDSEECLETPPVEQSVNSFFMGRYEVTVSQWCKVLNIPFSEKDANLPISNVSYEECIHFCEVLSGLTELFFDLPTEAEWEFAARGGNDPDNTKYAGSDKPEKVAWFVENSKKGTHECDEQTSGLYCNSLNLFDMSGNVSEWCLWTDPIHRLYCDMVNQTISEDVIYNEGVNIVRGGNYLSLPYELTVYHREASDKLQKSPNIGMRLIIRNKNRL